MPSNVLEKMEKILQRQLMQGKLLKSLKENVERAQDHDFILFNFKHKLKNNKPKSLTKYSRPKGNGKIDDPLSIINIIRYSDLCLRLLMIILKAYFHTMFSYLGQHPIPAMPGTLASGSIW